jgi:AraC-like DNA-binding protein
MQNWRVPPAYLKLFLQFAGEAGLPPGRLLAGTGLRAERLLHSDQAVDLADTRRVLSNGTRIFGAGWHLALARQLTISHHGPLGFAVVTAPDMRAAVDVLARFNGTRSAFVWLAGNEEDDEYVLRVYESVGLGDEREALIEIVMISIQNMLERPLGRELRGARIGLAYPAPVYAEQLANSFHAGLEFDAGGHLLSFPAAWLHEPCILHDAAMHRYLLSRCEEDLRAAAGVLPAEVAVRQALLASPQRLPSLGDIAADQHVSPRTLIRRLKRGGTSYKAILEDVRRTLAADYLRHSEMSVAAIAFRLGYQDPSNFGRAFRGWFGVSPGRYRARSRAKEPGARERTRDFF